MSYSSLLSEVQEKYESIKSLTDFLEEKFQEHRKDWAEDVDFSNFDFEQAAKQVNNQINTKFWYIPLSCNYLLLLIYSILEDTLNKICKEVELKSGINISLRDFAGRGIERATKYITKVAELSNIREDNEIWQDIVSWAVIRNAIAHSNGRIDDVEKIKKAPKTIKIDEKSREINLNFKDVRQFYEVSKSYLEYVFGLLVNKG